MKALIILTLALVVLSANSKFFYRTVGGQAVNVVKSNGNQNSQLKLVAKQ